MSEGKRKEKREKKRENSYKLIPMFIHKNGPCSEEKIKKTFYSFVTQFGYGPIDEKRSGRHGRNHDQIPDPAKMIEEAEEKDYIVLKDGLYHLSVKGKEEAAEYSKIFKVTGWIGKNINSAECASKNTFFIDLILTVVKLLAGFVSGSIALIADGTDAAIDTASALAVFVGVRYKKELIGAAVILIMMYFSSVSIAFESVVTLFDLISGNAEKLSRPGLVITIEAICMLAAWFLASYQRLVGRRTKNIALITQSVDSKNHIFVSLAVIVGAVFSIFNISIADIIIGIFIAVRIFLDALELTSETLSRVKGKEFNYEKYKLPFESRWKIYREKSFQIWILYYLEREGESQRENIISSMRKNFQNIELPLLSDFQYSLGNDYDFDKNFPQLTESLIKEKFLIEKDGYYKITEKGLHKIKDSIYKKISA